MRKLAMWALEFHRKWAQTQSELGEDSQAFFALANSKPEQIGMQRVQERFQATKSSC